MGKKIQRDKVRKENYYGYFFFYSFVVIHFRFGIAFKNVYRTRLKNLSENQNEQVEYTIISWENLICSMFNVRQQFKCRKFEFVICGKHAGLFLLSRQIIQVHMPSGTLSESLLSGRLFNVQHEFCFGRIFLLAIFEQSFASPNRLFIHWQTFKLSNFGITFGYHLPCSSGERNGKLIDIQIEDWSGQIERKSRLSLIIIIFH